MADLLGEAARLREPPGAERGQRDRGGEAPRPPGHPAAQARGGDAGGEEPRRSAKAKGSHRRGAALGAAGEDRRGERAVYEAARQEAPERSCSKTAWNRLGRKHASCRRGELLPERR